MANPFVDALTGTAWPHTQNNTSQVDGSLILVVYMGNTGSGGAWTPAEDQAFSLALATWQNVAKLSFLGADNIAAADLVELKGTSADPDLSAAPGRYVYGAHDPATG